MKEKARAKAPKENLALREPHRVVGSDDWASAKRYESGNTAPSDKHSYRTDRTDKLHDVNRCSVVCLAFLKTPPTFLAKYLSYELCFLSTPLNLLPPSPLHLEDHSSPGPPNVFINIAFFVYKCDDDDTPVVLFIFLLFSDAMVFFSHSSMGHL